MGQAGIELLGSANVAAIRDALDRLYCGHLVAVHFCLPRAEPQVGASIRSAPLGARRRGNRGPSELDSRAGVSAFQLPDCSDLDSILSAALSGVRDIIRAYRAGLEVSREDGVTTQLLIELVQLEIARESDLEAAATRPVTT